MIPDTIETLCGAVVQHGSHNNRIYIMHLAENEVHSLIAKVNCLAELRGYSKIFAKVPESAWPVFKAAGYCCEANVPRFFKGEIDGLFLGKYFSPKRKNAELPEELQQMIAAPIGRGASVAAAANQSAIEPLWVKDSPEMSALFAGTFATYPFPVTDPGYLAEMMAAGVSYYGIREAGRLVAVAAAEIDLQECNVEMTDFATDAACRGRGYASKLLAHMERTLAGSYIKTAYTISRASSLGMNLVFKRLGYSYCGLLANNTRIGDGIESMTVWHKALQ